MKNNILKSIILGVAFCGLTACVQSLNVTPIDPNTSTDADTAALFNKCYATLGLTGQQGPAGNGDVAGVDEGFSSLFRMVASLNEFTADGCWWIWYNDPGYNQLYNLSWTPDNDMVEALYYRLYINNRIYNLFIDFYQNADNWKQQVAEVRWLRALNYYYLLDMFQDVPFSIELSNDLPKQITRKDLYAWLCGELNELNTLLPDTKANEYRIDKTAADFLLMRTFLNAEVYTGTAQWDSAAYYAQKVMDAYELSPNYAEMFMGDNSAYRGNASATKEFVLSVFQGTEAQSYGGSSLLVAAPRAEGFREWGTTDKWTCVRTKPTLVCGTDGWFTQEQALGIAQTAVAAGYYLADETVMPILAGDDRCLLCQACARDTAKPNVATWVGDINGALDLVATKKVEGTPADDNMKHGWGICKWTGVYSTGATRGSDNFFPDTNIPLLRASEAWLTYAEAKYRLGDKGAAATKINDLRDRAHAANISATDIDDDFMLAEWQKEFYWEGRRRTDLIRFGKFTSGDYLWEGKYEERDARFNVFPIPNSDIQTNSNIKQYLGY